MVESKDIKKNGLFFYTICLSLKKVDSQKRSTDGLIIFAVREPFR